MKDQIRFEPLFEDNHLLFVNKPSGVLSQGDESGDPSILDFSKQYIKQKYNKPGAVYCGLVHRLDRPVSGVILLARTSKALSRLTEAFRTRAVRKIYFAITERKPELEEGTLEHYLEKDPVKNMVRVYETPKRKAKHSKLSYKILGRIATYYLLQIELSTGRSHQIRAQLAKIGCSIVGDLKYGAKTRGKDGRIYLHSRLLSLEHPVKKEPVTVTAPVPAKDQIWQLFNQYQPELD